MKDIQPSYTIDEVINIIRSHYSEMKDIPLNRQESVRLWIIQTEKGDENAKRKLIVDVETYLNGLGIYLGQEHIIYPMTTPYESLVYATYGLGVYDAIIHLSPFIESVKLTAGKTAYYRENGLDRTYPYTPTEEEMEVLQRKLSEIAARPFHRNIPRLSGYIESTETRLQMYMPPYSRRRQTLTRRFTTKTFSLDEIQMDERARELCKQSVYGRLNHVIGGAMGVGKTHRALSMLLLKDPLTESITIYESEHEMRLGDKWPGMVIELQSIESLGFEFAQTTGKDFFRNESNTVVFGEVREAYEAHVALQIASRGIDGTFYVTHLRIPKPEVAIRTIASLVNEYRRTGEEGICREITLAFDLFWILASYHGKRVDDCIFTPAIDEQTGQVRANVLAYHDMTKGELIWTGAHLSREKVEKMIYEGKADLDVLRELKVTDYERMI
ncbi:ATPase, T2SS/T4P/T4SS family [Brevibacillus dissolubilis]|uniref:ATPase, T2SS/T4P/T4SS family n=1 Tax=Brevibacillus dissolubilis TaxID=1844116 RepID=UPI001116B2C7|nr:ATPase, T2SS/T4P/T4SS family [Brevibacillus dissolubilis]